jgi:hypothetical protein
MQKPVVLLTATIHCGDTPLVERRDPRIREGDYKWAITGWLAAKGYDTLIFCENSGADLSKLEKYAASINRLQHKLIFLSYKDNSGAATRGKGYGEMEIIRHAIDEMTDLAPEQMLLKVTGRYRARNATRLLSQLESTQADICCSVRYNLTWAESTLFAITTRCAREYLLPRLNEINDLEGRWFEHALSNAVHRTILAGRGWSPLPCDPSVYGVQATYGIRFGLSPIPRIRHKARLFLARKVYY